MKLSGDGSGRPGNAAKYFAGSVIREFLFDSATRALVIGQW
jgi:hypothetical protein